MAQRLLQIHPLDDVLVALDDLAAGESCSANGHRVQLVEDVPRKHKVAARPLVPGDVVRMYGLVVGTAVQSVPQGARLTTRNLRHETGVYALREPAVTQWRAPDVSAWRDATFMGFHRSDGSVGTANHWLVIPLVFCENRNVQVLREALVEELGYGPQKRYTSQTRRLVELARKGASPDELRTATFGDEQLRSAPERVFENVDGIKFLTHEGGCGGTRDDALMLCTLLAAYVNHPNVAGATVLSLGCQNAQIRLLEEALLRQNPRFDKPLHIFDQQSMAPESSMISEAIKQTIAGLAEANRLVREPAPLNKLVMGVECGGSDGFSGISANPAMGYAADLLVALGGSVVLSEFPELSGVEQELIDRAESREVAERFVTLQEAYAARAAAIGYGFDMNPSPGNIKDGLLTGAMKSAGAARKGGTSPIVDVLDYGEIVQKNGLNLLCTPGNDVESTTGLAAAGCNLILFSTGLGTPTGNPVAPVVKIASNTELARRMSDVIDLDAGRIVSGEESIESMGNKILEHAQLVASGRSVPASVRLGQDDFIPWKRGISL